MINLKQFTGYFYFDVEETKQPSKSSRKRKFEEIEKDSPSKTESLIDLLNFEVKTDMKYKDYQSNFSKIADKILNGC